MAIRKIDPKKMDAYKRFIKSKKVDHDTIRMAHDNPNLLFVKRAMTGPKGNTMKKALDMYKGAAMKESFVIPEDIPFKERNAFMGAAASAAKAGKSHFNFGGKKHPVTMDKKVATKITDDANAMKAFLAKGGKITKLPPGKAQGYHGKDDPGKDMHGMMAKGDTKAMGTRKKVKSMGEAVKYPHMMYDPKTGKEVEAKTPIDHNKFAKMGYTHEKPKMDEALNKDDKPFVKNLVSKLRKGSKTHGKQADDLEKAMNSEAKKTVHSDKEDRLVTMKIKNPAPKKKAGETAVMNPKLGTTEKGKSEMEQKESTIRNKLLAVLEGDKAAHYKGATEPETMDDKLKGAGAKKMKADMEKGMTPNDTLKKAFDDVSKAGRAGPAMKARTNDKKDGDKNIMNPPEDITKKAGIKTESNRSTPMKTESMNPLTATLAAYRDMAILEAEGNVTSRHDVTGDSKSSAIAAVRKKAGPNVAVKHHGMTPNKDHDISVTGHPKHVMKFVNHHEQGKYSLDHAGHAKYKKDFGG